MQESVQVARQNYDAAEHRKRMSRTSKIQTRWTMNKQCKNERNNPLATTRIQRDEANNNNTHTAFLARFDKHADYDKARSKDMNT